MHFSQVYRNERFQRVGIHSYMQEVSDSNFTKSSNCAMHFDYLLKAQAPSISDVFLVGGKQLNSYFVYDKCYLANRDLSIIGLSLRKPFQSR